MLALATIGFAYLLFSDALCAWIEDSGHFEVFEPNFTDPAFGLMFAPVYFAVACGVWFVTKLVRRALGPSPD